MSHDVARLVRPYLFHGFKRSHLRSFSITTRKRGPEVPDGANNASRDVTHDYEKRVDQLKKHTTLHQCYPRLYDVHGTTPVPSVLEPRFSKMGASLKPNETRRDNKYKVYGKVESVRTAGSKLAFIVLRNFHSNSSYQVVCNLAHVGGESASNNFRAFLKLVRKGDKWGAVGYPHRTESGELSLLATQVPILLSPSLHQIPEVLKDRESRTNHRHVDMLVNPETRQTLVLRHNVELSMSMFLQTRGFVKVSTPLLSAGAGGAVARPFETEATELQGEKLNLRIAPELWLKRLAVGGMDRIYEMGPAFRNEGVDATHNPEFSICEFYASYVELGWLMGFTQAMLRYISEQVHARNKAAEFTALQLPDIELFSKDFERLEFIPTLEQQLGTQLPQLDTEDAQHHLLDLFHVHDIPVPAKHNLPRLLDALASHFLEPLCVQPTFITNHPACLSPLSKHFTCPRTGQAVAARAELFIRGREYANMYEEENSPFEQRRKFEEQIRYRAVDGEGDGRVGVDESYLEALEWGLPPTGGWGCGVDRLVMLFSGRERMADVLAFGNLRNVVGLGSSGRRR